MKSFNAHFLTAVFTGGTPVHAAQPAPAKQLLEPADGATVSGPFKVRFGIAGKTLAPAGDMTPDTGHHHLLINAPVIAAGEGIPADAQHLHFGKGQIEADVTLPPGTYRLTALFGNGVHQSYLVEESAAAAESVRVQTLRLTQAVTVFTLPTERQAGASQAAAFA